MNIKPLQAAMTFKFGNFLIIITLLAALAHAFGTPSIVNISNVLSGVFVAYLFFVIIVRPSGRGGSQFYGYGYLLTSLLLTAISYVVNFGQSELSITIKYIGAFAVYFVAREQSWQSHFVKWKLAALLIIPIAFLPFESRLVEGVNLQASIGYFVTLNAAMFYFVALAALAFPFIKHRMVVTILVIPILFGKVGGIIASAGGVLGASTGFSTKTFGYIAASVLVFLIAIYSGLLDRFSSVVGPLWADFARFGPYGIYRMSYDEISIRAGSSDVSGYFRLKHWVEIFELYRNSNWMHILFGIGTGQSAVQTELRLVPHNDYLRVLVELGFANLLIFIAFLTHVYRNIALKEVKMCFLFYLIFSFSDNALDNFSAIFMIFAAAGFFAKSNSDFRVYSRSTGPLGVSYSQ